MSAFSRHNQLIPIRLYPCNGGPVDHGPGLRASLSLSLSIVKHSYSSHSCRLFFLCNPLLSLSLSFSLSTLPHFIPFSVFSDRPTVCLAVCLRACLGRRVVGFSVPFRQLEFSRYDDDESGKTAKATDDKRDLYQCNPSLFALWLAALGRSTGTAE